MTSKRIFSRSKRQSGSEPYYRTGGLLLMTNDTDPSNGFEAKTAPKAGRRRPSNLTIVPFHNKQYPISPVSFQYNAALANTANDLKAVYNDMLWSPASISIQKPLPHRPRSVSAPSTPDLPAELPGSLLLENQGFPPCASPEFTRPTSQILRRKAHTPGRYSEVQGYPLDLLNLVPEPLTHARSVPDLSLRHSAMRSVRSGNTLNSSASLKVQHQKSLSDVGSRRRTRPNQVKSPSHIDSRFTTCLASTMAGSSNDLSQVQVGAGRLLQPAPLINKRASNTDVEKSRGQRNELGVSTTPIPAITRSKHIEELKATIAPQDETISTLQSQFCGLRASHKAHVASLIESNLAEVASLKNYVRMLEEQAQPSLHHTSSNNLLFLSDTTGPPQNPKRERSQNTAGTESASPITSCQSSLEKQQQSPEYLRDSLEMENLKRKLSTTRRPELTNRNLLPELNQYKQNNAALQKQIESLMGKLNESKNGEGKLRGTLGGAEQRCAECEDKAGNAEQLAKSVQALQNTIDNLESRLETANIERLDAHEQLSNLRDAKSPFDVALHKLRIPSVANRGDEKATQDAHMSMSTVFSNASPISLEDDTQENSALAEFIAHIERLQDQAREKDAYIVELEEDRELLQQRQRQLEQEHNELALQSDIQNELLRKTRRTEAHFEQLRTAVIDREAIIGGKEMSIRAVERQLECHKLLLQAEIRRNAAIKLHVAADDDPLPDLTSLAKKEDINRWINKLNERLKRERPTSERKLTSNAPKAQVESLQQEIDFYVREIIYFKLDIKGYKSDIRKLNRITTQLSSYGSRTSDLDSEASSLRPLATPTRSRFASTTPELGASNTTSPTMGGPVIATASVHALNTSQTPFDPAKTPGKSKTQRLGLDIPEIPQTPTYKDGPSLTNEAERIDSSISPRSYAPRSPERRNPVLLLPDQEMFGKLITELPLSTPAVPKRHVSHKRSMSDSILQLHTASTTSEMSRAVADGSARSNRKTVENRGQSASASAPERPPRPPGRLLNSAKVCIAPPPPEKDTHERAASYPALMTPAILRARAGSVASNMDNAPMQTSPPSECKLSSASNSGITFVIAMGSPHNPALISPSAVMSPTICSITRNAPLIIPPTSKTCVGGTMASSKPATSPVPEMMDNFRPEPPPKQSEVRSVRSVFAVPTRTNSLGSKKWGDHAERVLHNPSHSRHVSESSIRTTVRLSKTRDAEKEMHRVRKDSIGMPRSLGGPFGMERSTSLNPEVQREGESKVGNRVVFGIGEAI
ncbi:hypothetical protein EJ02DRAFT_393918 [Clathrospora elynae]|uniref:Uncharacterized protein n=1 Tax=Clathrospora elynae TaxID=706981 RepID=A0A6A5T4D9_9PLEO|nr:hypothetical protein EJ02DRAFT_393918 [Clathrospora elynae]